MRKKDKTFINSFFPNSIFNCLEQIQPSKRGEYEIIDAINMYDSYFKLYKLTHPRLEITFEEDIEKVNDILKQDKEMYL